MARWGRCRDCDKLVPINPKGIIPGTVKDNYWYPDEHDKPEGGRCEFGPKKAIGLL